MFASKPRTERFIRVCLIAAIIFNATLPSVALARSEQGIAPDPADKTEANVPGFLPEQAPQYFSPPAYTIPQQTSPEPDRPESPVPVKDQVEFAITADPAIVPANGLVAFKVRIRNNSSQTLSGLIFGDALETGFEYSPDASSPVSYNERNRQVTLTLDKLAPAEELIFQYSLTVTTSKRTETAGKVWLRDVRLSANDGALNLKTNTAVGVGLSVADAESRIATLSAEGQWLGLERVAVHMDKENIGRDGLILFSPARVSGKGPELQFKLDVFETTLIATDALGAVSEQEVSITKEYAGNFSRPAYLEIDLDEFVDLENIPAGQEPYVATYDESLKIWVKVPILEQDHEKNTVTVAAAHFSTWGAGLGSSLPQNGANVLLFDQPYTSLFTGSSRYSIPIWMPPGRGGMQPDVSLSESV